MKNIRRLSISLGLGIISLLLISSMAFALAYSATITLSETAGTAYTMFPARLPNNTTGQITSGFINTATGLDTRVLSGSTAIPHMLADDKLLFAKSVPAHSSNPLTFTTGNAALTSFDIIVGYGGYITVTDAATLEWGNNGSIEYTGYVETTAGADKNLVSKIGAFRLYVSPTVSGNITAEIISTTATTLDLIPNAAGDYTALIPTAGANYTNVDDAVGAPDDIASTVSKVSGAGVQFKDAYNLAAPAWLGSNQVITSVTVYFRHEANGVNGKAQPFLRLGGVETTGTDTNVTNGVWNTTSEVLARPGGGSWTTTDFADLQVCIGLAINAVATCHCTQEYVRVAYTYDTIAATVSDTGVASGEYPILTELAGSYFKLYHNMIAYYDINDDTVTTIDSATKYKGESFTTGTTVYPITNISLLGYRAGAPGTITVSISAVDGAGAPTGAVLTSGTYNANLLGVAAAWFNVPITSWTPAASTQYALFINCPTAAVGQEFLWRLDQTAPAYAGGMYQTRNGAAWDAPTAGIDAMFRIGVGNSVAYAGILTDSGNNWIITPQTYITNYTHDVGGIEVVHYQPVTYIVGTTLPDLTGAAENGAITWGSNPAGVVITMGGMTSTGASAITIPSSSPDAGGEFNTPSNMYPEESEMGGGIWDIIINPIATDTNTPRFFFYVLLAIVFVLGSMTLTMKYTQSLGMAGISSLVAVCGSVAMAWLPPVIIILAVVAVIFPLVMERSQGV